MINMTIKACRISLYSSVCLLIQTRFKQTRVNFLISDLLSIFKHRNPQNRLVIFSRVECGFVSTGTKKHLADETKFNFNMTFVYS